MPTSRMASQNNRPLYPTANMIYRLGCLANNIGNPRRGGKGIAGDSNPPALCQRPACQMRPIGFIETAPIAAMNKHQRSLWCSGWQKIIIDIARALTIGHIQLAVWPTRAKGWRLFKPGRDILIYFWHRQPIIIGSIKICYRGRGMEKPASICDIIFNPG